MSFTEPYSRLTSKRAIPGRQKTALHAIENAAGESPERMLTKSQSPEPLYAIFTSLRTNPSQNHLNHSMLYSLHLEPIQVMMSDDEWWWVMMGDGEWWWVKVQSGEVKRFDFKSVISLSPLKKKNPPLRHSEVFPRADVRRPLKRFHDSINTEAFKEVLQRPLQGF